MTDIAALRPRNIVIVGDALLDVYFMGEVRRISPEAPVPVVRVTEKTLTLGGAGNVALNVAGLGSKAILFGMRGDDAAGRQLVDILEQRGVEDCVVVDPSRFTTSKTRVIGHGQQLIRLDEEEIRPISASVRSELVSRFAEVVDRADAVVLSDYNKGVLTGEMTRELIALCAAREVPVLVDPKGKDWERYEGATCITPNISEIENAIGHPVDDNEELLVRSAALLRSRYGFTWMLVTRGAQGMCLIGPDESPLFVRATAREVYDVSGAGDTVIATLAVGVASGLPFLASSVLANAAAGIVVGKLGSQAVTYDELEATLRLDGTETRAAGSSKVTTAEAARMQVRAWRATGEQIVLTAGRFDELHPGQVHLLRQAKAIGGRVIVCITNENSDAGSFDSTPSAPSAHDRAYMLSAIDCVDMVIASSDCGAVVRSVNPDTIVVPTGVDPVALLGVACIDAYRDRVRSVPMLNGYEGRGSGARPVVTS